MSPPRRAAYPSAYAVECGLAPGRSRPPRPSARTTTRSPSRWPGGSARRPGRSRRSSAPARRAGVDDEQALGLDRVVGDRRPGAEAHGVLPPLVRAQRGRAGGVPGRGAPALPALGVDPSPRPVDRDFVDDRVGHATRPPGRRARRPLGRLAGGQDQQDRARGVGRGVLGLPVVGDGRHQLAHRAREPVDEPGAGQSHGRAVRTVVELEPVGVEEHTASQGAGRAVHPERDSRFGGDHVAGDPQGGGGAGDRGHRERGRPGVAGVVRLAGDAGVGGPHR